MYGGVNVSKVDLLTFKDEAREKADQMLLELATEEAKKYKATEKEKKVVIQGLYYLSKGLIDADELKEQLEKVEMGYINSSEMYEPF